MNSFFRYIKYFSENRLDFPFKANSLENFDFTLKTFNKLFKKSIKSRNQDFNLNFCIYLKIDSNCFLIENWNLIFISKNLNQKVKQVNQKNLYLKLISQIKTINILLISLPIFTILNSESINNFPQNYELFYEISKENINNNMKYFKNFYLETNLDNFGDFKINMDYLSESNFYSIFSENNIIGRSKRFSSEETQFKRKSINNDSFCINSLNSFTNNTQYRNSDSILKTK